jgi:hypothetical protein
MTSIARFLSKPGGKIAWEKYNRTALSQNRIIELKATIFPGGKRCGT